MQITPAYLESAAALAKEKPSFASSVHEVHLDSLGLSTNATNEIIKRAAPEIAAYLDKNENEARKIRQLPSAEQVEAIAKLHEGMGDSDRPGDSEATDKYIESRTRRGPGTGRYVATEGKE